MSENVDVFCKALAGYVIVNLPEPDTISGDNRRLWKAPAFTVSTLGDRTTTIDLTPTDRPWADLVPNEARWLAAALLAAADAAEDAR